MTEPRHAYIASTTTVESIQASGFSHGSGYTELFLDPLAALDTEVTSLCLKPGDIVMVYLYRVDLSKLGGMWPRVTWSYNDYRLRWSCSYSGKIPADTLKLVKPLPMHGLPENAKTPPTKKADGEIAGFD